MRPTLERRRFLQAAAATTAIAGLASAPWVSAAEGNAPLFKISLAQWSLHKAIFGKQLDNLDFAREAKATYGIEAVEYVNQFFFEKANDKKYLADMKQRAEDAGVTSLVIMVDREGKLGDPNEEARSQTVDRHKKWVEAAKFLGCHSLRVNAASAGKYDEQLKLAADGLARLSEFAQPLGLNIIVENHGGLSSNGAWLSSVIKKVDMENCGTLPDFGNFHGYDRYKGVAELMPFAKAVSAKSHTFNEAGEETHTNYEKMMQIVLDAGYRGYVGIEYEGRSLPEPQGIKLTKSLLERVRTTLAPKYE